MKVGLHEPRCGTQTGLRVDVPVTAALGEELSKQS